MAKSQLTFKQTEIGTVPEDWELLKIGDICWVKNGKTNTQDAIADGKFPLFDRSLEIKRSNKFLFDTEAVIMPGEGKEFIPRYYKGKFDLHQRTYAIGDLHKKPLDLKYVYYWINKNRNYLARIAVGSTVKSLRLNHLTNFPISLPSLAEQKAIVKILFDLDTKIELNQRMNKTLEAIAKAIFKHWFIDFEFPNENGEPYKSSEGEMADSELGKIPERWRVGKISEIATQIKDQISPFENPKKIYVHYSIEAYDSGMKPTNQHGSEILSNKFVVHRHTVLISKLNPRIPRVWPIINAKENSVCSTEFLVFKPKNNLFSYLYNLLLSNAVKRNLEQKARGTSGSHQRTSSKDIMELSILIPSDEVLELFENSVLPNIIRQDQNIAMQLTLAHIRNVLLPKLMSGRIRVPVEVIKNA